MKTCFKFTNDEITYIALPKTPEVVNLIKAKNDEDLLGIIFNYGDMGYRSIMNVPFITGNEELDKKFVAEAAELGLVNVKGHRLTGGMRASIYNAMPLEGVEKLRDFIIQFDKENK